MFLQRIRKLENKKSRLTKLHFSWISKNCETVKFDLSMQKSFIIGFRSNRSFLDMIHSKLWRSDLHLFDMIQSKKNINQKKFRISLYFLLWTILNKWWSRLSWSKKKIWSKIKYLMIMIIYRRDIGEFQPFCHWLERQGAVTKVLKSYCKIWHPLVPVQWFHLPREHYKSLRKREIFSKLF